MNEFTWVAVALVSITSTARLTRLLTWDTYPPVVAIRMWWDNHTPEAWNELVHCGYCASMYIAPAVVLSGYFTDWHTAWWLVNGTLGAAYLGAITMAYDGDD